jgi:CRP-like cAMP-binding protein
MDVRSRMRLWRMRKNPYARELSEIELFADCTARQLRALTQHVCPLSVEPGRVVARAGERCEQFILVVAGEAETSAPNGRVAVLGPGGTVGETAVDPRSRQVATVTARTPMDLLVASRMDLVRIIRFAPSVEQKLITRLAGGSPAAPATSVAPAHGPERGRHRRAA